MVAWSVGLMDVDVINDERKNYELIIVRWGASQRAVTGSSVHDREPLLDR